MEQIKPKVEQGVSEGMKTFCYLLSIILFGVAIFLGVGSIFLLPDVIKYLFYGYDLGLYFLAFIGWVCMCVVFGVVASFFYVISKPKLTTNETLASKTPLFQNRNIYHDLILSVVVSIVIYVCSNVF